MSTPATATLDAQLLSPDFLIDPYPVYARFRAEAPVYWSAAWHCWVLTGYADVRSALREDGRRLSVAGRIRASLQRLPHEVHAELEPLEAHYAVGLLHSDPPDH